MAAMMASTPSQAYQFAAQPKVVKSRKKYRDPNEESGSSPQNIMYDKRVVRGNTYASMVVPSNVAPEPASNMASRKNTARSGARSMNNTARITARRSTTPDPVDGRRHIDIQTDSYLEELTDKPPEKEIETQTDFFLDRPASPLFIPTKAGVDVETQIEEGELFDFDMEVEPLLEVLVGKTLEQSMMEVLEEEELAAMRKHQAEFEQLRNSELIETQRMEAEEMRRVEENKRRRQQEEARVKEEEQVKQKLWSRSIARGYLKDLRKVVMEGLEAAGVFRDPVLFAVQEKFMPWLVDSVCANLEQLSINRFLLDDVIQNSVSKVVSQHAQTLEDERERIREEIRQKEEEERRRQEEELKRLQEEEERERLAREAEEAANAEAEGGEGAESAADPSAEGGDAPQE